MKFYVTHSYKIIRGVFFWVIILDVKCRWRRFSVTCVWERKSEICPASVVFSCFAHVDTGRGRPTASLTHSSLHHILLHAGRPKYILHYLPRTFQRQNKSCGGGLKFFMVSFLRRGQLNCGRMSSKVWPWSFSPQLCEKFGWLVTRNFFTVCLLWVLKLGILHN